MKNKSKKSRGERTKHIEEYSSNMTLSDNRDYMPEEVYIEEKTTSTILEMFEWEPRAYFPSSRTTYGTRP